MLDLNSDSTIVVGTTIYATNTKVNQGITRGTVTKVETVETAAATQVTYTVSVHPTRQSLVIRQTDDVTIFTDVDEALAEYKTLLTGC